MIAAGMESDDDEFDDYYGDGNYDEEPAKVPHSADTGPTEAPIATQPSKPKRNSIISMNGSSTEVIELNDIRMAAINGDLEYLREIIEIKSDNKFFVDTILIADWTALMFAANYGHKNIVHYLIERGADPNYHADQFTPLMAVCTSHNTKEEELVSCARYLITFGAKVDATDAYGNSVLIYAAKSGKAELIQELLDSNANVNQINDQGWNALHWAVHGGYGKVIEKLLNNGIDATLKTNSGQTVADIALSKGYHKIKDILDNFTQRTIECPKDEENDSNIKLNEEEMNELQGFVRPSNQIPCRQKSSSIVRKVPDTEELAEFLSQSNYEYLLPEFEKHDFGYHDLVTNTDFVLNKIGVEDVKTIRKISAHIILLHKQDWKKESLKDLDHDTTLSCPEVFAIISNISSHLTRIDQTIAFLKYRIAKRNDILSHNSDLVPKQKIFDETLQTLINTRHLFNELQSLRTVIASTDHSKELQTKRREVLCIPFSLEDELNNCTKKSKSFKYSKSFVISVLSVSALTVVAFKYGHLNRQNCDNLFSLAIQSIPRPKFPKFTNILLTL